MDEQNLPSNYILLKYYKNLLEARIAQTELSRKNKDTLLFNFNGKKVVDPFVFETGGGNLYVQKDNYNAATSYLNPFRCGLRLFSKELGFSSISRNSLISVLIGNFILGFGVIFLGWGVSKFIIMSIIEIYISTIFGFLSLGICNRFAKPVNLLKIFSYSLFFMLVGLLELLTLGAIFGSDIDISLPLIYVFLPLMNSIEALYWPIFALLINHLIFLFTLSLHPIGEGVEVTNSFFGEITYRYFILQLLIFFISLVLATAPYSTNLKGFIIFIIALKTFVDIFFKLRWKYSTPEVPL